MSKKQEPVYTDDPKKAVTFRCRFYAREAIAELDGCPVGCKIFHQINMRGDGKLIIANMMDTTKFLASDISNKYSSKLND